MSAERAQAWLRKAENDLLSADNNLSAAHVPYDVVCFHCQQAAEKFIKGLIVHREKKPPRMHDLLALIEEASRDLEVVVPSTVREAGQILNPYAVEVRYPDDELELTLADAREARQAAEAVRNWVRVSEKLTDASYFLFGRMV